jgi:hypothetical protein
MPEAIGSGVRDILVDVVKGRMRRCKNWGMVLISTDCRAKSTMTKDIRIWIGSFRVTVLWRVGKDDFENNEFSRLNIYPEASFRIGFAV